MEYGASVENELIMSESKSGPPQWILRLLQLFCPPHLFEEIEGDLIQRFDHHYKTIGARRARQKLFWSVIRFFRPGILFRNNPSIDLTSLYMLSNYLKIALRVMFRNKTFSAINVSGLILGITGAMLLFLWINYEFSFDQFHSNKDQLHIAWNRATENGQVNCWVTTPRILAPTLEKEYSSVENAVSYAKWGSNHLFTVGETKLINTSGAFTDPAFLTMLSFPMLKGDDHNALENPNSIVLTESFARQLFGDKEAFGESLTISESGFRFEFTVSGILKDLPTNTDFKFDYLISFKFLESLGEEDTFWGNNSVTTLVKLEHGTDYISVNDQIKDIEKNHYADGQHIEIFLYPLTKMRLYSRFENGVAAGGRIEIMRLLGILGIFLVIIACINFINLCTARAQRRSKEVAIRKVTGAFRFSLTIQFLCESILIALFAGVLSIVACYCLLPLFRELVEQHIPLELNNINFWGFFVGLIIFVGLLAGIYPALYLSSFHPIRILKGMNVNAGRNTLRSALMVFQFGFALTMIISSLVVNRQIDFVQKRDAGYSSDNLIHLPLSGDLNKNFQAFTNELIQQRAALSITKTSAPITEQWSGTTEMKWNGKEPHENSDIERIYVDEHMVITAGLTLVQGRDMDLKRFPSDSTAVLLNETALEVMGFENPIGETIVDAGREWHVIGVVKDFVFTSPFRKIEPIVLFGSKSKWHLNVVYIKLNPENHVQDNLTTVSDVSKKYNPDYPFEYHFADIEYQQKFDNVNATLKLTALFTSVAIFIACLGLFGMSIYVTEGRMKEIGIRKVMGGTAFSITRLLSFSSLRPIVISIILFTPISWICMSWWLRSFAYRTELSVWVFVAAAFCILLISIMTIGSQTILAARVNPVVILRSE